MADRVRPAHVAELEELGEALGPAGLLVDLDDLAGAHHAQVGTVLLGPRLGIRRRAGHAEQGVVVTHGRLARGPELMADRGPVLMRVRRAQHELAVTVRNRVSIDATPAESGPRSLIWRSIAARCSPRRSWIAGVFANRPTIPHMGAPHPSVVGIGNLPDTTTPGNPQECLFPLRKRTRTSNIKGLNIKGLTPGGGAWHQGGQPPVHAPSEHRGSSRSVTGAMSTWAGIPDIPHV